MLRTFLAISFIAFCLGPHLLNELALLLGGDPYPLTINELQEDELPPPFSAVKVFVFD